MRDAFELTCSRSGAKLRFYAPQRQKGAFSYCRVAMTAPSANADFELYDFAISQLGEFFTELADHWKGWSGEVRWESVEDQATLSATCDRTGHVILRFELHEHGHTRHADLTVSGTLHLEAGRLEALAFAAEDFVST